MGKESYTTGETLMDVTPQGAAPIKEWNLIRFWRTLPILYHSTTPLGLHYSNSELQLNLLEDINCIWGVLQEAYSQGEIKTRGIWSIQKEHLLPRYTTNIKQSPIPSQIKINPYSKGSLYLNFYCTKRNYKAYQKARKISMKRQANHQNQIQRWHRCWCYQTRDLKWL